MELRLVACVFEGVHNGDDLFNDPPHRGGNADAVVVSRGSDSRTRLDPRPVIVVQANSPGNKGREVGIDAKRAHPHAFRHTYGRNCVLRGISIPVLQKCWATPRWSTRSDTWSWPELTTNGWPGFEPY